MARVAFVTGGASGIGRAIGTALARRGDVVVLADISETAVKQVAADLAGTVSGRVTAVGLDVRDGTAVQEAVTAAHAEHGRLDLMFNNAGIGVGGDIEELLLAHWDRVIDVNIRGVVHGVAAAYPLMIAQRSGHIVNTASLAGLVPSPLLAPYSMTKHAVVGLSRSLRVEAAAHGVRVTAVCPGAIDTPILDSKGPEDLPISPRAEQLSVRDLLTRVSNKPYPPARLAQDILAGVERNQALVIAPVQARVAALAQRLFPGLVEKKILRDIERERRRLG